MPKLGDRPPEPPRTEDETDDHRRPAADIRSPADPRDEGNGDGEAESCQDDDRVQTLLRLG
jgi:hypothetical protein